MISNRKDISAYKIFWQDRHYLSSSKIFHQNQFLNIDWKMCIFFFAFLLDQFLQHAFKILRFFLFYVCLQGVIQKNNFCIGSNTKRVIGLLHLLQLCTKQLVYKFSYSLCCFTQSLDYERIVLYYFYILITT